MTTQVLSERQRAALAAICDTLVPTVAREDDPHGFFAAPHLGTSLLVPVEGLIGKSADQVAGEMIRSW
jgi:hypothetical protein